jgi:thiamine biosynthesis lipoprotein
MTHKLGRRRFIAITAVGAGLGLVPLPSRGKSAVLHQWRGAALGAKAEITLHHPDPAAARRLIGACLDEITRLERIFSLYQPESALTRLNRDGRLQAPPFELLDLLATARRIGDLSGGAFDVTVQPLWRLHAEHFGRAGADPGGPPEAAVRRAMERVDYRAIQIDAAEIRLLRPGMALTLNGIAQGYITDRVADLLRREGMSGVLLDLGEIRALGHHPEGRPWRAALADPQERTRHLAKVELVDAALATSSARGTAFDATGRHHHLFDPAIGRSARGTIQASVLAPTATLADALSTALMVLPPIGGREICRAAGANEAWLMSEAGRTVHWRS